MEESGSSIQTPKQSMEFTPAVQSKSKSVKMLVMVTLHLFTVIILGYLIYQNIQLQKLVSQPQPPGVVSVTVTPTPIPVVTVTPTPYSTENWKTYTNINFNFSFRYPEIVEGAAPPEIDEQPFSVLLFIPRTSGCLLLIEIIPQGNVLVEYEKDKNEINDISPLSDSTFLDYEAKKATFPVMSYTSEIIYFTKGQYLYKINSDDTELDQLILSTFRFIE